MTEPVQGRSVYILGIGTNGALTQYGKPISQNGGQGSFSFSPLLTNGKAYFTWLNGNAGALQNRISSYAFSLEQPMGPLATAIRNKYLLNN